MARFLKLSPKSGTPLRERERRVLWRLIRPYANKNGLPIFSKSKSQHAGYFWLRGFLNRHPELKVHCKMYFIRRGPLVNPGNSYIKFRQGKRWHNHCSPSVQCTWDRCNTYGHLQRKSSVFQHILVIYSSQQTFLSSRVLNPTGRLKAWSLQEKLVARKLGGSTFSKFLHRLKKEAAALRTYKQASGKQGYFRSILRPFQSVHSCQVWQQSVRLKNQ